MAVELEARAMPADEMLKFATSYHITTYCGLAI
jgi:hypothetical protein